MVWTDLRVHFNALRNHISSHFAMEWPVNEDGSRKGLVLELVRLGALVLLAWAGMLRS